MERFCPLFRGDFIDLQPVYYKHRRFFNSSLSSKKLIVVKTDPPPYFIIDYPFRIFFIFFA